MPVPPFLFNAISSRVVHGAGRIGMLEGELERLGISRAMFCCTSRRRETVTQLASNISDRIAGICDAARIFVPIDAVEAGRRTAQSLDADGLISYGGGTSVGLAKAIALQRDIPIVSVVTTYSGSETTALQGILGRDGVRTNYGSPRMLPRVLIYDPDLTVDLPLSVSVGSGLNAISHAVSSFLGQHANPVADMFGSAGIRAMSAALIRIAVDPADIDARSEALYGAWLCGSTLMSSGTTIHHKIVHVLGGGYDLPHGPTHGIILPHSTAYNRRAAPQAMRKLARALGDENRDAAEQLHELLLESRAPAGLRELGLPASVLDEAADRVMVDRYFNLQPYDRQAIRELLQRAWEGQSPGFQDQPG